MSQRVVTIVLLIILRISWTPAGAESVWTSHGPAGGFVSALAIDPQNPSNLYAGTFAGLFKSMDRGMTWLKSGLTATDVRMLAVDVQNPGVIYAGACVKGLMGCVQEVFKTMDGGTTWTTASSGLPGLRARLSSLAIDPQNSTTLYVGTSVGLFKSIDGGTSWMESGLAMANSGYTSLEFLAISPQNPSIVYAAQPFHDGHSYSRLFSSMDGGRTWNASASSFSKGVATAISALAVDPQDPFTVYVAAAGADLYDLFKSTDGGTTWTTSDYSSSGPRANYIDALTVDPERPSVVYAGTNYGVYKSTDAGKTWNLLSGGSPNCCEVYDIAIDPADPSRIYAGFGDRVFEMHFDSPVLTLDSTKYCVGATWSLRVIDGDLQSAIRLVGASNGASWDISNWRETDANGTLTEGGRFADGTQGSHSLSVEIAGRGSDPISFVVSNCNP